MTIERFECIDDLRNVVFADVQVSDESKFASPLDEHTPALQKFSKFPRVRCADVYKDHACVRIFGVNGDEFAHFVKAMG